MCLQIFLIIAVLLVLYCDVFSRRCIVYRGLGGIYRINSTRNMTVAGADVLQKNLMPLCVMLAVNVCKYMFRSDTSPLH